MKKVRENLPLLPVELWLQIAKQLNYHTWSLFRRVSATANQIATEPRVVHSVMGSFFKSRTLSDSVYLRRAITLAEHQCFVDEMLSCKNPVAKHLLYLCIHGLDDRVMTLLSNSESPEELIFTQLGRLLPTDFEDESILTFVASKLKNPTLALKMIMLLKNYNYSQDPRNLLEILIYMGQQKWVFSELEKQARFKSKKNEVLPPINAAVLWVRLQSELGSGELQERQYIENKIDRMLSAAAHHGDVDFLCRLEELFNKRIASDNMIYFGTLSGSIAMVRFLVEQREANINQGLQPALEYAHFDIAAYLIQKDAATEFTLCRILQGGIPAHIRKIVSFMVEHGVILDKNLFSQCLKIPNPAILELIKFHTPISAKILKEVIEKLEEVLIKEMINTPEGELGLMLMPFLTYTAELLRWHVSEIKAALPTSKVCCDTRYVYQMRNLTNVETGRKFVMDVIRQKNEFSDALVSRLSQAFSFTSEGLSAFIGEFNDMMDVAAKAEAQCAVVQDLLASAKNLTLTMD